MPFALAPEQMAKNVADRPVCLLVPDAGLLLRKDASTGAKTMTVLSSALFGSGFHVIAPAIIDTKKKIEIDTPIASQELA